MCVLHPTKPNDYNDQIHKQGMLWVWVRTCGTMAVRGAAGATPVPGVPPAMAILGWTPTGLASACPPAMINVPGLGGGLLIFPEAPAGATVMAWWEMGQ